jgi:hypothetical protein
MEPLLNELAQNQAVGAGRKRKTFLTTYLCVPVNPIRFCHPCRLGPRRHGESRLGRFGNPPTDSVYSGPALNPSCFETIAPFIETGASSHPQRRRRRVVFGSCAGWVAVRQVAEKGGKTQPARTPSFLANQTLVERLIAEATNAAAAGLAFFAVPGTVTDDGKARAADVVAVQTVPVDIDHGDVTAMRAHLVLYLRSLSPEVRGEQYLAVTYNS